MKRAFITGVTGQDGSYLADLLLEKGYQVHGLVRASSSLNRIDHLIRDESFKERFFLHQGDLSDSLTLQKIIERVHPNEVYNFASMSHIKDFSMNPELAADVAAIGVLRLLDILTKYCPSVRLYQASSSELFGDPEQTPQNEKTGFSPRSLYGIAKLYAFLAIVHYRENNDLFACNGILFNHESPRRSDIFVSRKITLGIVRIYAGIQDKLILGNLNAKRDWGYAKDFVDGAWRMLQMRTAEDFVFSTGRVSTVREFVELGFGQVGMPIVWEGLGVHEKGIDMATGNVVVEVGLEFFRPEEQNILVGDSSKAREKLGWMAQTSLEDLVRIMIESDRKHLFSSTLGKF